MWNKSGDSVKRVPSRRSKLFWRGLKIFLWLYVLVGFALYHYQDKLLFHPAPVAQTVVYDPGGQAFTELNIPYDRETRLNIVQFKALGDPARGVVLYFHGNSGNIGSSAVHARNFTRK